MECLICYKQTPPQQKDAMVLLHDSHHKVCQECHTKLRQNKITRCPFCRERINKDILFLQEQGLDSEIVVCRELTKKFETIYRGSIDDIGEQLFDKELKGEITLVVAPPEKKLNINYDLDSSLKVFIDNEVPKREIAKAVSNITEYSVNEIYERIKDL